MSTFPFRRIAEDKPTPPEVYNWRLWSMAAVIASAAILVGYDSAFVGGAIVLDGFTNDFGNLAPDTSANLVTTYQAGAFFGAFAGYPLGHFIGRRWGIIIAAFFSAIGAILMVIASPTTGLGIMYVGRAVNGCECSRSTLTGCSGPNMSSISL
jgi:MFS family permease